MSDVTTSNPPFDEVKSMLSDKIAGGTTATKRFLDLAAQWRRETAILSSPTAIVEHPAYRAIIAMGPVVVPLVLRDLLDFGGHWFNALRELTGEHPLPEGTKTNVAELRAAWLGWGKAKGLLP